MGHRRVVGAREPRDGVEEDDDVLAVLDQPLGLLHDHLRDLHVPLGGLVEGRGDHLAVHAALHVRDFLGALVDQQHDQVDVRRVDRDRVRHLLQDHRLSGFGGRHDEPALPEADGGDEVDHAHRERGPLSDDLEVEAPLRIAGAEVVELAPDLGLFRLEPVHRVDLQERQIALVDLRRPHLPRDRVSGAQAEPLDLGGTHVDVVGSVQVAPILGAEKPVAFGQDLQHSGRGEDDLVLEEGLLDLEREILLAEPRVVADVELFGQVVKLSDVLGFELGDVHGDPRGEGEGAARKRPASRDRDSGTTRWSSTAESVPADAHFGHPETGRRRVPQDRILLTGRT